MYRFQMMRAKVLALLVVPALLLGACTDLSVDPYSQIPADEFFQTEEEVLAALAPLYANLRGLVSQDNWHGLSQVSTDETIVPTRGTDWGDGGNWLRLHRQSWDAGHPFINTAWVTASTGIARANGLLSNLQEADVPNKDAIQAEVRALRAFYYYILLDLFGRAPLIGDEEGEFLPDPNDPPAAASRAELFAFVEEELLAVRSQLEPQPAQNGRLGRDGVDAILANLYLNAPVFAGEVTAAGLQRGPTRYEEAFEYADGLIESGRYQLVDDWASIFAPNNDGNAEHIFAVQHRAEQGLGVSFPNRSLHYNSTNVGAWNGFSTLAETYSEFDDDDPRREETFLIGPQNNLITGEPIFERGTDPPRLVFTPEFTSATNSAVENIEDAAEGAGIRINKFPPDPNEVSGNHGNDYPFFRLGEMYLIRAEAALNMGDAGQALADVNALRERVDAPELTSVDAKAVLQERLYELFYEARRRQDLVRADPSISLGVGGTGNLFTRQWGFKNASEPYRVVFPIPQQQRDANPNLSQNAGY